MLKNQQTVKCLVVDDETLAQELLEDHISKIPELELVAKCHTAGEALSILNAQSIDILFLDIELPDLSGVEFLKSLDSPPLTVFTTAYSEYAIVGYELLVFDYLLKPITFARFFKCVSRILSSFAATSNSPSETPNSPDSGKSLLIKGDKQLVRVPLTQILYVEGMQKYARFHLIDKTIVSLVSLAKLERSLPKEMFLRVHKSYIVNLEKIETVSGNHLTIGKASLPLSKKIKPVLFDLLDDFNMLD